MPTAIGHGCGKCLCTKKSSHLLETGGLWVATGGASESCCPTNLLVGGREQLCFGTSLSCPGVCYGWGRGKAVCGLFRGVPTL